MCIGGKGELYTKLICLGFYIFQCLIMEPFVLHDYSSSGFSFMNISIAVS